MRRELIVAFALVASLLAVTAVPAAASHPSPVSTSYSSHSTATELGWGETTNLSVAGSGSSADVRLTTSGTTAFFAYLDTGDNITVRYINGTTRDIGVDASALGGVGDIDGDGDPDIAFLDSSHNVKYTDIAGNVVDTGANTQKASHEKIGDVGDVDDDGDLDILYVVDDASRDVRIIDADGNDQNTGANAYGGGPIGDWNSDGDLEGVVRDSSNDNNLDLADTDGDSGTDIGADGLQFTHGAADWDGDGDLDFVHRHESNTNMLYTDGSGNQVDTGKDKNLGGAVGDYDGDGRPEIVYEDTSDNEIHIIDNGTQDDDLGIASNDIGGMYEGDGEASLPAEYLGYHYLNGSTGGFANLTTMENVSVDLTWDADTNGDGTFDTQLAQQTGVTTTGNKSSTWTATTHAAVRLNVTVTSTGTHEEFAMRDEVVEYDEPNREFGGVNNDDTDFNDATLTNMTVEGSGASATVECGVFTPDDLNSLSHWYDASEISGSDGDSVSTWSDQAGTDDLTQGTGSKQPTLQTNVINGQPVVRFDGSDDLFDVVFTDVTQPYQVFVVFRLPTLPGDADRIFAGGDNFGGNFGIDGNDAGDPYIIFAGNTLKDGSADTNDNILTTLYNGSGSYGEINDSEVVSGDVGTNDLSGLTVGANDGDQQHIEADIAQVLVYNTDLSSSDESDVESYLADEYGISITGADTSCDTPAEYLNNHSATNTVGGWANISTADNVSITATWEGDSNGDGSYDTELEQVSGITAAGNHSFVWDEFSGDDVQLNLTVESDGTSEAFVLEDEGVYTNASAPTFDNSSADPSGGELITSDSPTLSIDVNDSDFGTEQGDSVDVEFFADGVSQGTDTLTSNGTASVEASDIGTGGTITWNATATDDAGHTATSADFTMEVPSTLQVRNATNESELITGQTIEATFYATDGVPIADRSTSDGNLSLSGLPVGDSFVVVVNTTNYHQRTIYIDDLFEQADIFLLNTSIPEAETVFEITDNTGNYPLDTSVIKIQRALNRSDYTDDEEDIRWITVTGEKLGTDGSHTTHLEKFERYRVVVENQDGDQNVLGEFVAEFDSTRAFQIGQRTFDFTDQESGVEYGAEYDDSTATKFVVFTLNDSTDSTENVDVTIYERGNESNVIYDATSAGPFGDFSVSVALSSEQEDDEWVIDWEAENSQVNGDIGSEFTVGQSTRPLDIGDQNVQTAVAVLALLLTFFMASAGLNRYAGAVVTPMMGAFLWYLGFMPTEVGAGAIIFALFLGGAYFASSSQAGGF